MFYHQWLQYLTQFCAEMLHIYSWQDYVEVAFFIFITHQTLQWLKQDHTKHLLATSYSYFTVLICSYYFSCNTLFTTGLLIAPAYMVFCIVVHQKQLQKNFVLPSKKFFTPITTPQKNWLETLIQSCLITANHKQHITCIIERQDSLQVLLQAPFNLELPIQEDITNLLLASNNIHDDSICWIHQSGIIHSINVQWSTFLKNQILITPANNARALTHEAALLLSQKTDALIFDISTTSDLHTVWYQGKCIKQLTMPQLLLFIKKILQEPQIKNGIKKGKSYDQNNPTT